MYIYLISKEMTRVNMYCLNIALQNATRIFWSFHTLLIRWITTHCAREGEWFSNASPYVITPSCNRRHVCRLELCKNCIARLNRIKCLRAENFAVSTRCGRYLRLYREIISNRALSTKSISIELKCRKYRESIINYPLLRYNGDWN